MIRNYLKTAFRTLIRHRVFSLINAFGLSISMAICLIIIMMVGDQMKMDRHLTNAENIYRINTQRLHESGPMNMLATSPLPIGKELFENYTGIENYTRIRRGFGNSWVEFDNDHTIPLGGFYVDQSFLKMFDLEFESGNRDLALIEPNSVVLTSKAAKKLFGNNDAMGQVIDMGEIGEYKVTGVLKETETKSHVVYEALASMSSTELLEKDSIISNSNENWESTTAGWIYVELSPDKSKSELLANLSSIDEKHYGDKELVDYRFLLQNILDINPGPLLGNQIGPGLPMIFVYFLGGLALIVMISACFNYTNLSIAKSINRAKEVGVRKVAGAMRNQIFTQFILESVLISIISLLLAYGLVVIIEPAFHNLKLASLLKWELSFSFNVIAFSILFAILVGLIAGIVPSLILSAFQPIKVLKDFGSMKLLSKMGLRKVLLTGQLTLSLFFIISVLLLRNQLDLMVSSDKGFNTENIFNVPLVNTDGRQLKNELVSQGAIENSTLASHIPAAGMTRGEHFMKTIGDERVEVNYYSVDEDYIDLMGLELLAGRNFSPKANENVEHEMVVNETAVEKFGFANLHDALGKSIFNEDSLEVTIVGVIKDYNHQVMLSEISPMALRYKPEEFTCLHVKVNGQNTEQAENQLKATWAKINPVKNIQYKKISDEINAFYDLTFGDLTKVVIVFSVLALSIASLGLLGMTIYTTQTRLKEVSIRKVLGATDNQVVYILSKGFVKLLLVAIALAIPLSYFVNDLWLQSIAYRVSISPGVIIGGTFIMIAISALTIGSQTIRTGLTNPVDNLKNE